MRNTAFLSTAAALLIAVAPVSAENDFDALLGDLTFSDTPTSNQTLTLDVAAGKSAESLKPAPAESSHALTMPPAATIIASPVAEPTTSPSPNQVYQRPAETGHVDFGQAFATQECDSCRGGGCDAGNCSSGSLFGNCGSQEPKCETCIPYHQPQLPSSTLRQYFRSDACNVDVWNGFRNRCCFASKHTRGECDCFNENRGCMNCETIVYDAPPCCEPRVCTVPSISTNRFFNLKKRIDCQDRAEKCDTVASACDAVEGTCD